MEPCLKNFLVQNGLNMAVKPLIAVGVDAACAVEFIDEDVVQIMRSEHALPLVTAKMLKAKLPLIIQFASTKKTIIFAEDMADAHAGGADSVQHELDEFTPDTAPHHKLTGINPIKRVLLDLEAGLLHRSAQETEEKNHFEMDCAGNLCVENAMENADAAGENELGSCNQKESAGAAGENELGYRSQKESAGVAGENELGSRSEKESADAAGENELGSRSEKESADATGENELGSRSEKESADAAGENELGSSSENENADAAGENELGSCSDKESTMQSDVLRKKKIARRLVSEKHGYQCPKCMKFFYSSSKQTFSANKTRHINACNGLKSISRNASGSSQSSQTDRAEKKRSFLVHKALQAGCDATEDETESELISYAQCLLNLSQSCEAQKQEKRGRFEGPLTLRHYTTSEENECCRSIGQKFMIDPGSIFELNKKRYRGFKTIDTRLKAGTDIIITAELRD